MTKGLENTELLAALRRDVADSNGGGGCRAEEIELVVVVTLRP